jgi:hypothetical protein
MLNPNRKDDYTLLYNYNNRDGLYCNRKVGHILKILDIIIFLGFEYNF